MKLAFTVVVMGSFLAIAVFGIFTMNHGGEHNHGCIAAAAQGVADCPDQASPFAFLAFHLDAFKNFSTATFGSFMASFLLLALAFVYVLRSLVGFQLNSFLQQTSFIRFHEEQSPPIGEHIRHWLALHENSPSVI